QNKLDAQRGYLQRALQNPMLTPDENGRLGEESRINNAISAIDKGGDEIRGAVANPEAYLAQNGGDVNAAINRASDVAGQQLTASRDGMAAVNEALARQ